MKDLFKSTKRKLATWLIVFLIMPWKAWYGWNGGIGCLAVIGSGCPSIRFFSGLNYIKEFILTLFKQGAINEEVIFPILWMIVISFIISLIIIFIYNKIRKRAK